MFNFFKSSKKDNDKYKNVVAIANGTIIPLEEVADPVFSQKMMGDGIAVELEDEVICAPVDGKVETIFPTNHAIVMQTNEGVQFIIHIGIDTVNLEGEGYEALVKQGEEVKAGTPLMKVDVSLIESKGYSAVTPVVVANMDAIEKLEIVKKGRCEKGEVMYRYCK